MQKWHNDDVNDYANNHWPKISAYISVQNQNKEAGSDNKTSENGDSKPAEPGEMDVD